MPTGSSASGKRAGRPSGAGPAVNTIEAPDIERPRIQVNIAGVGPIDALVDSGAYRTVAALELMLKLGSVSQVNAAGPLRGLGGYLVPTLGQVEIDLEYEKHRVTLRGVPVVRDASHSLILGQDWIAAVGEVRIVHSGVGFKVEVGRKDKDVEEKAPDLSRTAVVARAEAPDVDIGTAAPSTNGDTLDDDMIGSVEWEAGNLVTELASPLNDLSG